MKNTIIAGLMLIPGLAMANLVHDGSFEAPLVNGNFLTYGQTKPAGPNIGSWKVTGGSVDLVNAYWGAADGKQSLDMSGSGAGTIEQVITGLVKDKQYLLTFDMASNPDGLPFNKKIEASLGSESAQFTYEYNRENKHRNMQWVTMTYVFTADAATEVLRFREVSLVPLGWLAVWTPWGAALDNVSLSPYVIASRAPTGSVVPEPSTIISGALMLLPFGVGALRFMRRQNSR